MGTRSRPTRVIYVDDSGAESTGIATFSWVSLLLDEWRDALDEVLTWRRHLTTAYGIPKHYEMHATKFANGRGNPSLDPSWNRRKSNRSAVLDEAFDLFAGWSWMHVGTLYATQGTHRESYRATRLRAYASLVRHLDASLTGDDEWGMLIMDGDGTDTSYISAHRQLSLSQRSLLEDPAFQNSARSQWVQIADLVAYAGYQSIARIPEKHFSWRWYEALSRHGAKVHPAEGPGQEAGPVDRRTSGGSALPE